MKIYFENGPLLQNAELPITVDVKIDAGLGHSNCEGILRMCRKTCDDFVVYTNYTGALSSMYGWNCDTKKYDIFMRENTSSDFVRIDQLAGGGRLRPGQNIEKMFTAGCFGCIREFGV